MTQLILFRALQGLGAGALFPIALAVIGDLFSPRERGRYQGFFGAVFGLSFIIGPFIGGWLTDNVSWHWVFYVNLPLGIASLAVIASVLPNFHPTGSGGARDIDYLGIAVFSAGVVPVLLGLTNKGLTNSRGQLHNWSDPSVAGLIILGLALLAVFLFIESRARQPIIPLNLFRNLTYSATNLATFMISFGMFASVIFIPRYYQAVRGISATKSGYMIWPLMGGLIAASVGTGFLISKTGRYKVTLLVSLVFVVVGGFLMTRLTATTTDPLLWFWMLLIGLGIGPSMAGFTVVVQNSAPPAQLGVATSTLTFLRQIGGSVGLAIAGTLFSQGFTQRLPGQLSAQGIPRRVVSRFTTNASTSSNGSLTGVHLNVLLNHVLPVQLHPLIPRLIAGTNAAFSLAIGQVFWLTAMSAIVAFLAVALIPDLKLRDRANVPAAASDLVTGGETPALGTLSDEAAAG